MTDEKGSKPSSTTDGGSYNEKLELEVSSHTQPEKFVRSPAEQRVYKKINRAFVPYMCVLLFFQFCDKTTLTIASVVDNFFEDTHIDEDQYRWVGSIFYLGYLCMQLPNNFLMQRFPISKYLGTLLVVWGGVLFSMAWSTNFGQLLGQRFLLGFFEAITYPCMFILIASFYRRSEQVVWMGVMFISNGLAGIIGVIIGVGILQMPTVGEISPWKWCMILFGAVTIFMGIIYFLFMPDTPKSRWFRLTEEEKVIVDERTHDNAVVATRAFNWAHVWEALKEPRLYLYCLISLFINFQNGALTIFSSIIIKQMGFSGLNSVLLNIPSGCATVLLTGLFTYLSKRYSETIYVAIAANTVSLLGCVLLAAIPGGGGKLAGLYLSWSGTPTYLLLQASITSNVAGYTKKNFYTACNMIFYTFGNFIGPLLLANKDAPRYLPGVGVYIAANVICIICFILVRILYVRANKKRDVQNTDQTVSLEGDLEDITDVQNPHYVYRT